ncbi:hypothetical protein scyTo_0023964, partial [Scyliorhinus torazame]|nr:hypothetical protein [Scyliorhinus torazame]
KQTLKIFDGDDTVKRNQFRLITVPRISKAEEAVVSQSVTRTRSSGESVGN